MNFSPSKTSMTLCRCNTQANALMHECPGPKGMWMLAKDFGEDADTLTNTDESPQSPPYKSLCGNRMGSRDRRAFGRAGYGH